MAFVNFNAQPKCKGVLFYFMNHFPGGGCNAYLKGSNSSKNVNFLGAGWNTFSQILKFLIHLEF